MPQTWNFAGGNRITLSTSGSSVTISGANAQTGISAIQNSQTTYTSGTISLSGLTNITIRSTNTAGVFQFSAPDAGAGGGGTVSMWPDPEVGTAGAAPGIAFTTGADTWTFGLRIWPFAIPEAVSANRIRIVESHNIGTVATSRGQSMSLNQSLGIYTKNASTLSLLSSFFNAVRWSQVSAANSTNMTGSWNMTYGQGTSTSTSSLSSLGGAGMAGLLQTVGMQPSGAGQRGIPLYGSAFSLGPGQYWFMYGGHTSTSTAGNTVGYTFGSVYNYNAPNVILLELGRDSTSTFAPWPLYGSATASIGTANTSIALPVSLDQSLVQTSIATSMAYVQMISSI